jgi:hypothetical protein
MTDEQLPVLTAENAMTAQIGEHYLVRNPETGEFEDMLVEGLTTDLLYFTRVSNDASADSSVGEYAEHFQHIRPSDVDEAFAFAVNLRSEFAEMLTTGNYYIG